MKKKSNGLGVTHEVRKIIKDLKIEEKIDFEGLEFDVIEMEKML